MYLLNIDDTHPGLREFFEKGVFSVRRTPHQFSRCPVDLTLEQTVKVNAASRQTGLISTTNSARLWWMLTKSSRAAFIGMVQEMAGLTTKEDVTADCWVATVTSRTRQTWYEESDGAHRKITKPFPELRQWYWYSNPCQLKHRKGSFSSCSRLPFECIPRKAGNCTRTSSMNARMILANLKDPLQSRSCWRSRIKVRKDGRSQWTERLLNSNVPETSWDVWWYSLSRRTWTCNTSCHTHWQPFLSVCAVLMEWWLRRTKEFF